MFGVVTAASWAGRFVIPIYKHENSYYKIPEGCMSRSVTCKQFPYNKALPTTQLIFFQELRFFRTPARSKWKKQIEKT